MSQIVEGNTKAFTAGAALGQHILVKLSSGVLAVAGLNEQFLGTVEKATFASGDTASVRLRSCAGTMKCVASGAFSAAALVYGRADGKVDDIASGAICVGQALEAATAASDIVEVLPCAAT